MKEQEMNPGIPKNVREALAGQAVNGPHPAADLLNAYSERALTASEDAQVAGHLATCADCREVIFLASAADEAPAEIAEVKERAAKKGWWRWAMPATAVLALVMSFLVIRQSNRQNPDSASLRTQAVAIPAKTSGPESTTSTNPNAPQPTILAKAPQTVASDKRQSREADKSASPAAHGGVRALTTEGDIATRADAIGLSDQPVIRAKVLASAAAAPAAEARSADMPAPQPTMAGATGATMAMVAISNPATANYVSPGGPSQRNQAQANYSNARFATKNAPSMQTVEVQSEAASIDTISASAMNTQTIAAPMKLDAVQKQKSSLFSAPLRWRVSAQGYLERLVGDAWRPAMSSARKTYRTVAVMGSHVWAGGSGPEIVHSPDDGNSWATLRVGNAKEPLRGSVKTIHADDPWHLAVITDDGNTWTTADGGQTWNKE